MLYKWNKNELIIKKETIKKVLKNNYYDENILNYLEEMKDIFNEMINISKNNNTLFTDDDNTNNINYLIKNMKNDFIINKKYINILLKTDKYLNEIYNLEETNDYKLNINNKDYIDITSDFFKKMTTTNIYKEYKRIIKNEDKFLNIDYYNPKIHNNKNYSGYTLIDFIYQKKYIAIIRKKELYDLVILPHELFHYIFNDYNYKYLTNENHLLLSEIEGALANILFSKYFQDNKKIANKITDRNYFKNEYLKQYSNNITNLIIRDNLIKVLNKNNSFSLNKLNDKLYKYNIDIINNKEEVRDNIKYPINMIITYSLSYLAAIDLYYIYLNDREKSFYLLNNIRKNINNEEILKLLKNNNVNFFENDFINLKKYIKK